jgi:hypothetical protein
MTVFDYPRVNFSGTLTLTPATANNCDYANAYVLPPGSGPGAGQALGLIDSKLVRAITYGMDDETFRAWVQRAQTFDTVGKDPQPAQILPAEWNYYGDLGTSLEAQVVGVTTGPGTTYTEPEGGVPATQLLGAALTFAGGHITDVNSEGSPPATQFFVDQFTLAGGGTTFLTGTPSKGVCQWLNFYRNVNLTADGGAGGYVYHVVRGHPGTLPGFEDPGIVGVVLRYYLFGLQEGETTNAGIEAIYKVGGQNPAIAQVVGTIAPLYGDETILTTPVGRLLVNDNPTIKTSTTNNNGGGLISLGPAVLRDQGSTVTADFLGTFPDNFQPGPPVSNPKFDFGPVALVVSSGSATAQVATVDYTDTAGGDAQGWVFDFDISSNEPVQKLLAADPDATFSLVAQDVGPVLDETDHFVVTNQQAIYAEQHGTGSTFLNQGTLEPASVAVFRRGRELSADDCPPITVWQYRSIPLQAPGLRQAITNDQAPGEPIVVDTSEPGDYLFSFSVNGGTDPVPPEKYSDYMNPPALTNAPSISLRILPNDEDFSVYYEDPEAEALVGNEQLTWDVVYEKVLRTYYLLYPVMDRHVLLNSEKAVVGQAAAILETIDPGLWMKVTYMPRTRDMSASRRQLLQAFCRKALLREKGRGE